MNKEKIQQLDELVSSVLKSPFQSVDFLIQGGGCINKAIVLDSGNRKVFIKWNYVSFKAMFEKEIQGLQLLENSGCFQIPKVYGLIDHRDESFLIMEHIEADDIKNDFDEQFGSRLAKMHMVSNECFGLDHDNFIGTLHQKNSLSEDWCNFFIENRIQPQLELAFDSRRLDRSVLFHFDNLFTSLNGIFPSSNPSLLHGDLWGGNILKGKGGLPVLIDPAVYFGHHEMELAYMHLFDRVSDNFLGAYDEIVEIENGFMDRIELYNLYPLLVHVNLFGGGYA